MAAKDTLFAFIKSLTAAEKKYFRTHAGGVGGKDKNYLHLFNYLDKQESYDEAALRKRFRGEKFLQQLHVTKHYLFKLLLKHLVKYHMEGNPMYAPRETLNEARILVEKGFIEQAKIAVSKSEQEAIRLSQVLGVLNARVWKMRILIEDSHDRIPDQSPLQSYKEICDILDEINTAFYDVAIGQTVFNSFTYNGPARTIEQRKELTNHFEDWIKKRNPKDMNEDLLMRYHDMHVSYYLYVDDCPSALKHARKCVQLFEESTARKKYHIYDYLLFLENLGFCQRYLGSSTLKQTLAILKEVKPRQKSEEAQKWVVSSILRINWDIDNGRNNEAYSVMKQVLQKIPVPMDQLAESEKAHCYSAFARACIAIGAWEEACIWLNHLVNERKQLVCLDLVCYAHLQNIVAHLELGNYRFIPSLIKSTEYFIRKLGRMHAFELAMLALLRTLISRKTTSPKRITEHARKILALKDDPYNKFAFRNFDFDRWLNSIIENPMRFSKDSRLLLKASVKKKQTI